MGWSSGSQVFKNIWEVTRHYIPDQDRVLVCKQIIIALQKMDWDCEGDFMDSADYPEFNEALKLAEEHWNREYNRFNTHEDDV